MMDRLAEIQARLDAATPGKWLLEVAGREFWVQTCTLDNDAPVELVVASVYEAPDATFIANAPTDIAYLLERVRELEMAIRQVTSDRWGFWCGDEDCPEAGCSEGFAAYRTLRAALTEGESRE